MRLVVDELKRDQSRRLTDSGGRDLRRVRILAAQAPVNWAERKCCHGPFSTQLRKLASALLSPLKSRHSRSGFNGEACWCRESKADHDSLIPHLSLTQLCLPPPTLLSLEPTKRLLAAFAAMVLVESRCPVWDRVGGFAQLASSPLLLRRADCCSCDLRL